MLKRFMAASDADALGAGFSSIAIYLLMALVLIVKPQGLVAAPGFQS
jgi:branched-chain amino acid transport system permease protein